MKRAFIAPSIQPLRVLGLPSLNRISGYRLELLKPMIRAVLDNNILLTALRTRNGASFEIVRRYARGEFSLVITNTVLTEYEEVLKREGPAFGLTAPTADRFLDALCAGAEEFSPSGLWKPSLPDANDESFAQLVLEAKVVRDTVEQRASRGEAIRLGGHSRHCAGRAACARRRENVTRRGTPGTRWMIRTRGRSADAAHTAHKSNSLSPASCARILA